MSIRNTGTGGQILIDQLVAEGLERVTCVPGESISRRSTPCMIARPTS